MEESSSRLARKYNFSYSKFTQATFMPVMWQMNEYVVKWNGFWWMWKRKPNSLYEVDVRAMDLFLLLLNGYLKTCMARWHFYENWRKNKYGGFSIFPLFQLWLMYSDVVECERSREINNLYLNSFRNFHENCIFFNKNFWITKIWLKEMPSLPMRSHRVSPNYHQ